MFKIIKKTPAVWQHELNGQIIHLSSFGVVADISLQTFILRALNGSYFPQQSVGIADIILIDETDGSVEETFGTINELLNRLVELNYTPYISENSLQLNLQQVTDNGQITTNPIVVQDIDGKNTYYSFGLQHTSDDDLNVQSLDFETPTTTEIILIPNESGTIATREWVNGNLVPLTLQQVTDEGNETNQGIILISEFGDKLKISSDGEGIFNLGKIVGLSQTPVANITETSITLQNGAESLILRSPSTNSAEYRFPDTTSIERVASREWVTNELVSKQNTLVSGTNIKTIEGQSLLGSGNIDLTKSDVGLGNVDNTSDANKPISTATQTALNDKIDKTSWINISTTSTIIGFSSFSQRFIFYKIIDNYIFIDFYLEGTSNSTSFTFTSPFNNNSGASKFGSCGYNVNAGSVAVNPARLLISNNSNLVNITLNFTGAAYSATGTKGCAGQISFKIN